jgi:predicted nucleic acid-binding protein
LVILPDSSAWIDFLHGKTTPWTDALTMATASSEDVVVGDLILAEVLQGIRADRDFREARRILHLFPSRNLCDPIVAEHAAENYRSLRKKGITIRATIDVIIATWCIRNGAMIIHNDRDLAVMEAELGLVSYTA